MQKLKKLLPLLVVLGILLVASGLVFGLECLRAEQEKVVAVAVIVPLEDGVWKLYPEREPELIYRWQSNDHFLVDDRTDRYALNDVIFDGSNVWLYERELETLTLFAENQTIDYTLGPAGVTLGNSGQYIKSILCLHGATQRTEFVDWCEQPVSFCSATLMISKGDTFALEIPRAPQSNWGLCICDDSEINSITQREDRMLRVTTTNVSHNSHRPRGQWFEATPQQKIAVEQQSYNIYSLSSSAITEQFVPLPQGRFTPEERTTVYSLTNSPVYRLPHRFVDPYDITCCFFLSPAGSLYCRYASNNTCVDRFSDIDEATFASAEISDQYFALPTDSGTRVYAWFQGYEWVKFDIPVSAD